MTFGSSWMLWGVMLGAIPIIVHLLHRRRHREVPWAAMRFLLEATRKNSRRIRLEQLILLVVRTLILVLLAIALARPFVASVSQGDDGAHVHLVVVLDATYSMQTEIGDGTRFDRAKRRAAEVIRNCRRGDVVNLVLHRAGGPKVLVREPSNRHGQILAELERLEPTNEDGALLETLNAATALLESTRDEYSGQLVFIGDLQRLDWDPESVERREAIDAVLAAESRHSAVTLLDVADADVGNVAVTRVETDVELVTVGEPLGIVGTLRNHDSDPRAAVVVELHVDGRLRERTEIDLPARGESAATFGLVLSEPGEHVVEIVAVTNDGLPIDDRRASVVRCRQEINVLLVEGAPSARFADRGTAFLEVALAPDRRDAPWQGVLRPRTIRESELQDVDLGRYDCVFLCNVGLMTSLESSLLRRYVEGGGGLVISLGDRVRLDNLERLLFATDFTFEETGLVLRENGGELRIADVPPGSPARRSGLRAGWSLLRVAGQSVDSVRRARELIENGSLADGIPVEVRDSFGQRRSVRLQRPTLLPARPRDVVTTESAGSGFMFDAADLSHPIVRAFEGNPEAGLLTTRIPTYVAVDRESLGPARVALAFSNGDPVIVEKSIGRGRSILVTTAFDRNWGGAWPGWPSFPQMMQELVAFAVERGNARVAPIGTPFEITVPGLTAETRASIARPDGTTAQPRLDDAADVLSYDATNVAGVYDVDIGPPVARNTKFAIAVDEREGQLQRAEIAGVVDRVNAAGGRLRTDWTSRTVVESGDSTSNPLATSLLVAVCCLLLVESLMAWRFRVGLIALAALVLGGFLLWLTAGYTYVAIPLLLTIGAGVWWFRRRVETARH